MRILRRLLSFIASRMLLLTVVSALLIISFYLAMNTANIWVLITDGLDARAGVVLMKGDASQLDSYFRQEFLSQDPVLQGRAEIIESIEAIDGTILSSTREAALAAGGQSRLSPPKWATSRYRVTLVRTAGRWKISNLQLIEQIEDK